MSQDKELELELESLELDGLDELEQFDYESLDVIQDLTVDKLEKPSDLGTHLFVEGLVLKRQVHGVRPEPPMEHEDMIIPVYAEKNKEIKLVGYVELTTHNILAMQQLMLTVSLRQEGAEDIYFDKVEHLIDIAKTLKEADTVDISSSDFSSGDVTTEQGPIHEVNI